jgi:hypothetical protein
MSYAIPLKGPSLELLLAAKCALYSGKIDRLERLERVVIAFERECLILVDGEIYQTDSLSDEGRAAS